MSENTVLIAVAPNGARPSRKDHPVLPITPDEIAETAAACVQAGAAMIHLHIRDERGEHSLDPARYRRAIAATRERVGDSMLIQVSSEAAGRFTVHEQVAAMEKLMPDCVSIGLREYFKNDETIEPGAGFLARLYRNQTLIQYVLYSPEEVRWYERLCEQGIIPGDSHLLLFVLGRYGQESAHAGQLTGYLDALERPSPWMVCAFGSEEQWVMKEAIKHGGHCRIGFENNFELADGRQAKDNAELVQTTARLVKDSGAEIAGPVFARRLFLSQWQKSDWPSYYNIDPGASFVPVVGEFLTENAEKADKLPEE